jgi:hypothetical protein
MIRYLLNIFWVVTGRPNRVSEPYRPTLMIECNEWREERLVKRLRDERIMREFRQKLVNQQMSRQNKCDGSQYALNA